MRTHSDRTYVWMKRKKLVAAGVLGVALTCCGCSGKHDKQIETNEVVAYEAPAEVSAEKIPVDGNKATGKLAKDQVPKVVVTEFEEEVPVAEYVDWYSYPVFYDDWGWYTIDPVYEVVADVPEFFLVEYTNEGKPEKRIFSKDGGKFATRRVVKEAELPQAVLDGFGAGKYKDWKITGEKEEVILEKDHRKVYKLVVAKGLDRRVLFFDPTGQLVHEKVLKSLHTNPMAAVK